MTDELKKIILAGIGSAAYTYEKAAGFVDDLVDKGRLTINEGRELSEELKRNIKETTQNRTQSKNEPEPKAVTKEDIAAILREMNLATKDDIANIQDRLTKLEQK